MLMVDAVALLKSGRSPRGERGLKFGFLLSDGQSVQGSLPPRGAWIEMSRTFACLLVKLKSLPPRGAWIEIYSGRCMKANCFGRSPRGERGLKFRGSRQI